MADNLPSLPAASAGPIDDFAGQLIAVWRRLIQLCRCALAQPMAEADALRPAEYGRVLFEVTERFKAWLESADGKRSLELEAEHQLRYHVERLMDLKADPDARWATARRLTDTLAGAGQLDLADRRTWRALQEAVFDPTGVGRWPIRTPTQYLREVLFPMALVEAANEKALPRKRKQGHRQLKNMRGEVVPLALDQLPFRWRVDQLFTDAHYRVRQDLLGEAAIPRAPLLKGKRPMHLEYQDRAVSGTANG